METVLDDNGLKEFIDTDVPKPTDAAQVADWQKKIAKCRRILLEGMRDHIVSSLHGKASPFFMWKALTDLYQSKSDKMKLALKDKLINIKCENGDNMPQYLTKFTQCRDELGSVGVNVNDEDLVSLALIGLLKSWHSYQDSVNGREKFPGWERLWSDLVQEEIRRSTRDNSSSMHDVENCALASKVKKGKKKGSLSESSSSNDGKKVDKSKVRCFCCHELGHYATNCPKKKSKKGSGEGSEGEALASQFELDFTLFACMVSSKVGSGWFLDSRASFHMTDDKSVGTVIFQREHGSRITLADVKYVPGLKRNLVSIAMLEDRGYDVVFREGKVFLKHIITRQVKQIGSRVKNLYALEVQDACKALSNKATDGDLVVEREGILPFNMQS
eukprot:PITA_25955